MLYYHLNSLLDFLSEKFLEFRIFPLQARAPISPAQLSMTLANLAYRFLSAGKAGDDFGNGDEFVGKAFGVEDDVGRPRRRNYG